MPQFALRLSGVMTFVLMIYISVPRKRKSLRKREEARRKSGVVLTASTTLAKHQTALLLSGWAIFPISTRNQREEVRRKSGAVRTAPAALARHLTALLLSGWATFLIPTKTQAALLSPAASSKRGGGGGCAASCGAP